MEKQLKTGTTTLGIVCKDGIILAADRRATAGFIVDKKAPKIHQISDYIAITTSGSVSDLILLKKVIQAQIKLEEIRRKKRISIKEASNLLSTLVYSNIRSFSMIPGITQFLLAGSDNTGVYLYDIYPDGSLTLYDDYVSSGSGSIFAYGVLEALYNKSMSVQDGVKLAVKAMNAALQRDMYSGNGIDIYKVTNDGVEKIMEKEIDTVIKA